MLMDYIKKQLYTGGFDEIPSQGMDCTIWLSRRRSGRGVCVFDCQRKLADTPGLLDSYLGHIETVLGERLGISCHMLALIITDDIALSKSLERGEHPRWFMSEDQGLIIFEDQPAEFAGLEKILTRPATIFSSMRSAVEAVDPAKLPWVTIVLIAINVLIWLAAVIQEKAGATGIKDFMTLKIAGFNENPELWRLLTSAFFHFGWTHIFNNMLVLAFLGFSAELHIGRARFLFSYLLTGICANVASVWWYTMRGELAVVTAGASGAVFGMTGVILAYIVLQRGRMGNITGRRLVVMMALTMYNGMMQSGINNCAHAAGAITGFVCGAVMYFLTEQGSKRTLKT